MRLARWTATPDRSVKEAFSVKGKPSDEAEVFMASVSGRESATLRPG